MTPDSWITHVSGHPPGALLTFVWLDRIGLGGGAWAGMLCLTAGSSAAAAIIVVQQRYWQCIAVNRPFQHWGWANFASVVSAIGIGSVAGVGRTFDIAVIRRREGLNLLVLGALTAIVFADLSS